MKVLLATQKPFAPAAVRGITEIIEKAGHSVALLEKYEGEDQLVVAAADADAMIVRSDKVTAGVIAACGKLKIVVRAGAGYDNIDLEAATAAGIVVMNTPGQNSNAVAELALGLMIYISRGQFTPATGNELSGRNIGIQAFGNVGRLVGAKAAALGMNVLAFDPFLSDEQIEEAGATAVHSLEELYSQSDFVSIHIPATPKTVGSIGKNLFDLLPKGATVVNTARKEVINESELASALLSRPDLKYVADVAPDNYALLRQNYPDRVFATPKKMGAQTAEANINAGLAAARQICDYFATGCEKFRVNR